MSNFEKPSPYRNDDARPNIVFVLVDQWRGDCLSALGHPTVKTPNLDELANRGALFSAAYAACPTCIPARANIWTGQTPSSLGWLGFATREPWNFDTTLPHELKLAGYQTACIGKTHFHPPSARLGFEVLESYEGYRHTSDADQYVSDYEEWLAEQGGHLAPQDMTGLQDNSWLARPSHLPESLHNNTWVITRGLEFLRRRDHTRPFFLNLSFHRPHPPFDPPQVYYDMYKDAPLDPVPIGDWAAAHDHPPTTVNDKYAHVPPAMLDRTRRSYYAQIAHIDMQIGRLVMRMISTGLIKNTWFVFVSDHGEMLGDHHQFKKGCAMEGAARIPMIITPPRTEQTGGQICVEHPVSHFDLMPTVLDIAGAPVPECVEGRSLLPLLRREEPKPPWRSYIHGEHTYRNDDAFQYVTDGKEKFIWMPMSGRELFFDLQRDPGETRNAADDVTYSERVDLWRHRLICELAHRTDDRLTDGTTLIAGRPPPITRRPLRKPAHATPRFTTTQN